MKRGIELNGIANINIILQLLNENSPARMVDADLKPVVYVQQETLNNINQQLELLERYMIAFCDATNNNTEPPKWHEVRQNPNLYPTNREKFK